MRVFNNLLALIRHDIFEGILRRWKYYLAAVLLFSFVALTFVFQSRSYIEHNKFNDVIDIADFIINVLAGNKPFDPESHKGIDISIQWLAFHSFLSFCVGFYVAEDLKKSADSFILRTRSRIQWWISKLIWSCFTVIIYYLLFVLTAFLIALICGDLSFDGALAKKLLEVSFHNSNGCTLIVFLLFSVLISIALSVFQITLSLVIKPFYSFLIVVCYMVASAFYCNDFLLYNFTMLMRNADVSKGSGFIIAAGLILISCVAGTALIKKKDVI
jgi:hypothetical protein